MNKNRIADAISVATKNSEAFMIVQPDENPAPIMTDRRLLARIAKDFIPEFNEMAVDQIIGYVSNEPLCFKEITATDEKKVTDIVYEVRATVGRNELSVLYFIDAPQTDVEKYELSNRIQYHMACMISAQDFDNRDCRLRPCYSVWVIVSPVPEKRNTVFRYVWYREILEGNPEDSGPIGGMDPATISLGDADDDGCESLRMLNAIFSTEDITEGERSRRMKEMELGVDMNLAKEFRDSMNDPRTFLKAHYELGRSDGFKEGKSKGITECIAMSLALLCKEEKREISKAIEELNIPEDIRDRVMEMVQNME